MQSQAPIHAASRNAVLKKRDREDIHRHRQQTGAVLEGRQRKSALICAMNEFLTARAD